MMQNMTSGIKNRAETTTVDFVFQYTRLRQFPQMIACGNSRRVDRIVIEHERDRHGRMLAKKNEQAADRQGRLTSRFAKPRRRAYVSR